MTAPFEAGRTLVRITHDEEVTEMMRTIPSRRLVTAILATVALAITASPLATGDQSGSAANTSKPRSFCPPGC